MRNDVTDSSPHRRSLQLFREHFRDYYNHRLVYSAVSHHSAQCLPALLLYVVVALSGMEVSLALDVRNVVRVVILNFDKKEHAVEGLRGVVWPCGGLLSLSR